nr:hypothetical protein [uncultured bacterium]
MSTMDITHSLLLIVYSFLLFSLIEVQGRIHALPKDGNSKFSLFQANCPSKVPTLLKP